MARREDEIDRLSDSTVRQLAFTQELLLKMYRHVADAIGPCPAHGEECMAYAFEWVTKAKEFEADLDAVKMENARLRVRLNEHAALIKVMGAQLARFDEAEANRE